MNDEEEIVVEENSDATPVHQSSNLSSNTLRNSINNQKVPSRLNQIRTGHTYRNTNKNNSIRRNSANKIEKEEKKQDEKKLNDKIKKNKFLGNNIFNRFNKKKENNNTSSENQESNDSQSVDTNEHYDNNNEGKVAKKVARRTLVWALTSGLSFFAVIFGVFLLCFIIMSAISSAGGALFTVNNYGTSNFQALSDKDSAEYQDEINYYRRMKDIAAEYKQNNNEELNISFIHSIVVYLYYQIDEEINYKKMEQMLDIIVDLLPSGNIDYSVGGQFYYNLKNSSEFREYYQKLLEDRTIDDILNDIFELGQSISIEDDYVDDAYISNETWVNVNDSGNTVYKVDNSNNKTNNQSTNSNQNSKNKDTNTNKPLTFKEYIHGVIYANVNNDDLGQDEKIKALVIAYTTNIMAKNSLSINAQFINVSDESLLYCSSTNGCSFNANKKLQSDAGNKENGNNILYGGKYYYKTPLSNSMIKHLDSIINEVYGNVLTDDNGAYVLVDLDKLLRIDTANYKNMLNRAYPDLTIRNILENTYTNNLDYGPRKVATNVIFYDQNDYGGTVFCGRKGYYIKDSGCGVTSMAIVASTYENSRTYDPVYMMNRAYKGYKNKYCGAGISGTSTAFFQKEASNMGYKSMKIVGNAKKKVSNQNIILSHLSQGHLIIIHVGKGSFTGGGHYMVLSGVDPETKKVYVHDPNNRSNKSYRKTGNGWYSFNDIIIPQAKGFYIIWKG